MSDKLAIEKLRAEFNQRLNDLYLGEATIVSSEIAINNDAEEPTQLMQSQLTEDNDVQTIEEQHIPGVQYNPPVESRGFFSKIAETWKIFLGIDDNVPKLTLNPGERIAYASASGAIVCSLKYNDDGSIDLTAPGDFNVIGNLNVSGDTTTEGDSISNNAVAPISANFHESFPGNLGFNVGPPLPSASPGTPAPSPAPSIDGNGNIVDGNGTKSTEHGHPYTWTDPAGSGTTGDAS